MNFPDKGRQNLNRMDYDIFISYRREGGLEYARPIKAELEKRGYRVFFDFDELKDGVFDRRIMDAIDAAPIFMIIVSEHSLERCLNANDWVRKEIEYAIAKQKHFIPINPDYQFKGYPEGFPEFLKTGLGRHQFSDIVLSQLFKASMSEMITNRIEPFFGRTNRTTAQEETEGAIIHIETDTDCRVLKFGKEIALAYAGKDNIVRLRKGKHKLEFASLENEEDRTTSVPSPFVVEDNDNEDFLSIQLQPIKSAREKKELEELELFPKKGKNGKYGFINKSGKEIIPFKYDHARRFFEMLATIKLNGKYGFIDKTGNVAIPIKYDGAWNFYDGFAMVNLNEKWGYIDKSGKEITPFKYDYAEHFSEGRARVKIEKKGLFNNKTKYGFIDNSGKEIIPLKYDYANSFSEGLALVKIEKKGLFNNKTKYGFINKSGDIAIHFKYDEASPFSEGLAAVKLNGKWGYIDKAGNVAIPIIYNHTYDFDKGLAWVNNNGKYWFIDKTGKWMGDD